MATGLEQVHAVTEQALKQLDQEARRLNRRLAETREDITKAKAEYEQVMAELNDAKSALTSTKEAKAGILKDIDAYRQTQIQVIESAGAKVDDRVKKAQAAEQASAEKEQAAQAELSKYKERRRVFLDAVAEHCERFVGSVQALQASSLTKDEQAEIATQVEQAQGQPATG